MSFFHISFDVFQLTTVATIEQMGAYARAGTVAEEAIIGVRIVAAHNAQYTIVKKYEQELADGRKYGMRKALWDGILTGAFFFILYIFLGLGIL